MTDLAPLFVPLQLGAVHTANRVYMAPLTRNRAHPDGTPHELAIEYYRQRASAGLIFTEATQISAEGKGYINTPGIHTDAHVAGWRAITDAVHEAGGKIALQLWHVGRISHTSLQPHGQAPVAPSAVRAKSQTFIDGMVDVSEPRALQTDEIPRIINDYRTAAEHAKEAGFDAVEVHSANGYLLDQFLQDNANRRTDSYGGDAENRAKLTLEVTQAVAEVWGADRVGVRLSPTGVFNDMADSNREETFSTVIKGLDALGLAFLHVVERFPGIGAIDEDIALQQRLRTLWSGNYIANGDFTGSTAASAIDRGYAQAVTFGRPFIANPDLPQRIKQGAPLTKADHTTFYGGDAKGYTDYPTLQAQSA